MRTSLQRRRAPRPRLRVELLLRLRDLAVRLRMDLVRHAADDEGSSDGVDVDGEVDVAEGAVAGGGLDGRAGGGIASGAGGGLEDELVALAVAQPEQRRRAEQLGVGARRCCSAICVGGGAGRGGARARW